MEKNINKKWKQCTIHSVSSRTDMKFLCDTLDDIFGRFQVSSSYFYGDDKDQKVLKRISDIRKKYGC